MKRLDVPALCSSISRLELKGHHSLVEGGLFLAVTGMCALIARLGWARKKLGGLRSTSVLKILKTRMRSARKRLRSSEKMLDWSPCALRVECGGCFHYHRPQASFPRLLVQTMSRNRRNNLSAQQRVRLCPLHANIFHAATKDRNAGERMRNEQN